MPTRARVLRRLDAEHREALSTTMRNLRSDNLKLTTDATRLTERHAEAKRKLDRWVAAMEARGAVLFRMDANPPEGGTYVAPTIVELDSARELMEEVFGPVLHVMRWRADELNQLLDIDEEAGEPLPNFGVTEGHLATRAAVGQHQE